MDNVTQAIADRSPDLLAKLVTNPDLCNVVLGLLARCIVLSQQRAMPIEGVAIGELENEVLANGDLALRARVTFHPVAMSAPAQWPLQSEFAHYVRAKAHGLGIALQRNPKLAVFFQSMTEALEQYAQHKGIAFGALVVKQSIISRPGDRLVLKVGRTLLNA